MRSIPSEIIVEITAKDYEHGIHQLEKHIARAADGTFVLDVKSGQDVGVKDVVFAHLVASMEITNGMIRSGELRPDQVSDSMLSPKPAP